MFCAKISHIMNWRKQGLKIEVKSDNFYGLNDGWFVFKRKSCKASSNGFLK